MEADWDLQAVVRGCCTSSSTTTATTTATNIEDHFSFFAPMDLKQEEDLLCFSDLFETSTVVEELELLYKPFFPNFQPISSRSIPSSIPPILAQPQPQPQPQQQQQQQQQEQRQQQQQQPQPPHRSLIASVNATSTTHSQTPRPKRRKNQQKKVVCQVPAEGLSSDMWAWRKYGQKPIKGSPYPRGYYRCSSSKGCLARKQVERNRSDPSMFIVTYTAEHNHPVPTHRNSLAGSTRQKFSTPQRATAGDTETPTNKPACSSSSPASTTGLSPTTPLTASMDDELLQQSKQESREDEEEEVVEDEEDELLIPDVVMSDDLFMGLDELVGPTSSSSPFDVPAIDDCFSDHFQTSFPSPWFPNNNNNNNATTAAGGS